MFSLDFAYIMHTGILGLWLQTQDTLAMPWSHPGVYSLSSWRRRTCRLVFMVSCDPVPPPQCSWFSSKERERTTDTVKLNSGIKITLKF